VINESRTSGSVNLNPGNVQFMKSRTVDLADRTGIANHYDELFTNSKEDVSWIALCRVR